jgi:hypothetical protein
MRLCGLTFELRGCQRGDTGPALQIMHACTVARARWHAVGAPRLSEVLGPTRQPATLATPDFAAGFGCGFRFAARIVDRRMSAPSQAPPCLAKCGVFVHGVGAPFTLPVPPLGQLISSLSHSAGTTLMIALRWQV